MATKTSFFCLFLNDARSHSDLCLALMEKDQAETALPDCRAGAQLEPESDSAHYNLALALHKTRDLDGG